MLVDLGDGDDKELYAHSIGPSVGAAPAEPLLFEQPPTEEAAASASGSGPAEAQLAGVVALQFCAELPAGYWYAIAVMVSLPAWRLPVLRLPALALLGLGDVDEDFAVIEDVQVDDYSAIDEVAAGSPVVNMVNAGVTFVVMGAVTGLSARFSGAYLLERQDRLEEALQAAEHALHVVHKVDETLRTVRNRSS